MASLNLDEQLFIRTLARELGVTEATLEAAICEGLRRAECVEVTFANRFGGLTVELGEAEPDIHPYTSHKDFYNAKARLGRAT